MRVLVTGSRNWRDTALIWRALLELQRLSPFDKVTIAHGANPNGADAIADSFAERLGYNVYRFPAEWGYYGRPSAGPIRNTEMLDTMLPDLILAFPMPESAGTWDMVRQARQRGAEVRVFHPRKPYR